MLYSWFSRIRANHRIGNSTTTIQAPSVNFTTAKIATTTADSPPAAALMASLPRQPRSLFRWW